jgi:hypothetical protein
MKDPTEFYDDLEHSIFKNNAYLWDQSWVMTPLRSLWCHKPSMEQGMLGYSTNCYEESFLSLNLLESEIL